MFYFHKNIGTPDGLVQNDTNKIVHAFKACSTCKYKQDICNKSGTNAINQTQYVS